MYQITAARNQSSSTISTNYNQLINSFLSGKKETTLKAYRMDLENFCFFLSSHINREILSLDEAAGILLSQGHGHANNLAINYKADMIERSLQPATINRRLAALRSLVELANTLGIVSWSLNVSNVKLISYRDTKGPGKANIKEILSRLDDSTKGVRDKAIIILIYTLGLRRGEIVSLNMGDINFNDNTIMVLSKGRNQKQPLTLPQETREILNKWVTMIGSEDGPLFINLDHVDKGRRLEGNGLYKIIKKYGADIGIKTRPHGIRHTAITEALKITNGNITAVAKFSRHKNISTVTIYNDNLADEGGKIAQTISSGLSL